jgi:hypothetical protein
MENQEPAMYDSRADTLAHIRRVEELLHRCCELLAERATMHDQSKLMQPEKSIFDACVPKLKDLQYGSAEYKQALVELKPALDHHYSKNSHHPEHEVSAHEEWRDVVGYEGLYQVSSVGRVRTIARVAPRKGEKGDLTINQIMRKAYITPKGYVRVMLCSGGKLKNHMVHTLVAEAFIGPAPSRRHIANHKYGIKSDNRASQLEWVTPSENQKHAYATGLRKPATKYVFLCEELKITALGSCEMARACHAAGHTKVSPAGLYGSAMNGGSHQGLHFSAAPIEHEIPYSGINGMSLFDVMEMLMDWKAATERMKDGGDIWKSIDINTARFAISEQLRSILVNTAVELGWLKLPKSP